MLGDNKPDLFRAFAVDNDRTGLVALINRRLGYIDGPTGINHPNIVY